MAVLTSTNLTLLDWAKRTDPEGKVPVIAELLSQTNEILSDAVFRVANGPTAHTETIRTGLPDVYWRQFNQGIASSKSTTAQVEEPIGILEARSEVDKDLMELNGNTAEFRLSEDRPFLEAMNQEMASTMFAGNPATDPKKFLGLQARYSALTGAGNSQNVLDAGGSGSDNTSMYLVVWSDETVFCTFPKGSRAGLAHEDLGIQTVYTQSGTTGYASSSERMQAYCTRYQWKNGLVVKDWRYVVRIANIDVSELLGVSGDQELTDYSTNLLPLMARALDRIPNIKMGRAAFYCNRTVKSGLAIQSLARNSSVLSTQAGLKDITTTFLGVPIRLCDKLTNTETALT
jgi:hypothetical protein